MTICAGGSCLRGRVGPLPHVAEERRPKGAELGQLPQILDGGPQALVFRSARATQAQSIDQLGLPGVSVENWQAYQALK